MVRLIFFSVLVFGLGCGPAGNGGHQDAGPAAESDSGPKSLRIFHTSDEHGALLPEIALVNLKTGGAAELAGQLQAVEGFDPEKDLLISSGDNWTGHAISTYFEGKSTVEAMNAMNYHASTVGNHEWDFGIDALEARAAEAEFPFVAMNLIDRDTGEAPDFAQPFLMLEKSGIQVAILGVTYEPLRGLQFVHDRFDILPYPDLVESSALDARAQGAELVLVAAHIPGHRLALDLSGKVAAVDAIFGGHAHVEAMNEVDGVPIFDSGALFNAYTRLDLLWDEESARWAPELAALVHVESGAASEYGDIDPDPEVKAIVEKWTAEVEMALSTQIGHAQFGFARQSLQMSNWISGASLWAHPDADAVYFNSGSIRANLNAGPVTHADVWGIQPFDNNLVEIEVTGGQLRTLIATLMSACPAPQFCSPVTSGVFFEEQTLDGGSQWVLEFDDGTVVADDMVVSVIITDYMYEGGTDIDYQALDDTPNHLGVNYRDPTLSFTEMLESDSDAPLEDFIDMRPRTELPREVGTDGGPSTQWDSGLELDGGT
jgi:2',3'-cyclic-nucleotide 2'-phosphodiesterase (5'-nucleotidase family)